MFTKDLAIEAVRKSLPSDSDVMEEETIEKPYGWIVFSQTKQFLETKNPLFMAVGSGGTLVEKNTGRLIKFGSVYPIEINLKVYEAGYFEYDDFDLIITRVSVLEEATRLLRKLNLSYVIPEGKWRIPKSYTEKQFKHLLSKLPSRFNLGPPYLKWETLEEMKRSTSLQFELVKNEGFQNGI